MMTIIAHIITAYIKLCYYFDIFVYMQQVELCDDDEFLVLACDGIWYVSTILYYAFGCLSEKLNSVRDVVLSEYFVPSKIFSRFCRNNMFVIFNHNFGDLKLP